MSTKSGDLLAALKAELDFLNRGGYRTTSWRPNFIFEDSPSCLNYQDPMRSKPCSDCVLMQLVPPDKREERIPCRFIPLNALGTTVESLYQTATQDELEAEIRNWLKTAIEGLEKRPTNASQLEQAPEELKAHA